MVKRVKKFKPPSRIVIQGGCASGDGNRASRFLALAVTNLEEVPRTLDFYTRNIELCKSCFETLQATMALLGVDMSDPTTLKEA